VRREKTSVSQEDYLKAIWETVQEEQAPISARLAEELDVTPPAVTAALKRMTRGGYVRVGRDGRIELSAKGRAIAQHLVLRHRLAEMLLTQVIGESRCPHGVPLFGGMAKLRKKIGAVRLSSCTPGHTYEILRVYEKDPKFLEFVANLELKPGVKLRLMNREYDQTMTVSITGGRGRKIYLGKPATERIWVRQIQ
jgi:DtxR family Mn-dependent transcriptional regulator